MATSTLGTLQEFKPEVETITAYLERLKAYYDANDVQSGKRVAVLLSVIGPKTYSILRSLMAPDSPQSKSYDALSKALINHFDPKPIVIAERYHFHLRHQSPTETIAEYVAELRHLASSCDFGSFLDQALRDRFVCGLRNDGTRRKLLTEPKLTLPKAIELAQCMEMADKNSRTFKGAEASVQKISSTPRERRNGKTPSRNHRRNPCRHCGRDNYEASQCRFSDATCHHCGKKGHIAPICRTKKDNRKQNRSSPSTKYISQENGGDSDDEFYLHIVTAKSSTPITASLTIEGRPLQMVVDTGAAFSIISESTRKSKFADIQLRPSSIRLKTYTEERINVLGQLHVHVEYKDQRAPLVLLVVDGDGPTLMGRNWMPYIRLDWKNIHTIQESPHSAVEELTEKFAELFKDELGKVSDLQVTLHVKPDARPIFKKARPVPFAIKASIDKELDELESNGVISKVAHSDWAAPIVITNYW